MKTHISRKTFKLALNTIQLLMDAIQITEDVCVMNHKAFNSNTKISSKCNLIIEEAKNNILELEKNDTEDNFLDLSYRETTYVWMVMEIISIISDAIYFDGTIFDSNK